MPVSRWMAAVVAVTALAGCGDEPSAAPRPAVGAARPTTSPPPERMDDLEQPVARRLAPRLADDGLTLQHVECPRWSGAVPVVLHCKGYVDGVVGAVEVELSRRAGGRVEFDAWLATGVLAMTRLVERLERQGYTGVDCGRAPAYPARLGMEVVCRVHRDGRVSHVVATVVDRNGAVRIEDY